MILDKELEFSEDQAITATAYSENVIDLGPEGNNLQAIGTPDGEFFLHPAITEEFDSGGATTLAIALQSSVDEAFSSPITHWTTPVVAKAALLVGAQPFQPMRVPHNVKRYVRLQYVVATGPFTAGKMTVRGGASPQTNV